MTRIVILGAGPAGVTVAETIRRFDKACEIIIISDEPYYPYSPPAMTDYLLTGKEFHIWKGPNFIEDLKIKYINGKSKRVVEVDPEACRIVLLDGEKIYFDDLVIATGGRLSASIKGVEKKGLYNFKSLSAAEEIMTKIREKRARSALIIGAGFIGIEIAVLLRELRLDVTQLVRSRYMRGMLDEESSKIFMSIMRGKGINILKGPLDADTVEFIGSPDVKSVRVKSGKILTADLVIAATGIRPNVEFLSRSGIKIDDGVVVDEFMRTNYNQIYACGDVAETFNRITRKKGMYPSFHNAINQGIVTAYNILGMDIKYEGADRINSIKHIGIPLITAGNVDDNDNFVVYKKGKTFKKIFLKDGRIVGFVLLNDITNVGIFKKLMDRQVNISAYSDNLLDENFGEGFVYQSIYNK